MILLRRLRLSKGPIAIGAESSLDAIKSPICTKISLASINTRITGVDLIRELNVELEDEQSKCHYPILDQLGVKTQGKTHSFSITSDNVIKFVKLGMVNRNLAVQYCHYLAHLCRNADLSDKEYYNTRVVNLTQYILKQHKDLPLNVRINLLVDVASTSEATCSMICKGPLGDQELRSGLESMALTRLLSACYAFGLWDSADKLLEKAGSKRFYWSAFDSLAIGLSRFVNSDHASQEERDATRTRIFNHLQKLFKICHEQRIQFITKQTELLVQSMGSLMSDVFSRPNFKMSGRCTHCDTVLPLYDDQNVSQINRSIREVLDRRHLANAHLYSSESDLQKFYQFLEKIYKIDRKPIGCVIDGLNLAYKNSFGHLLTKQKLTDEFERTVKRHNPFFQVQVLANAIIRSNFLEKFGKILVIGKSHMKTWPGLLEFFEKNNIHFYASDNQTKDDLFMLYASTLSHKTLLVTNDFLRDHLALLENQSRTQLERYIDTHQVWIDNKTLKAIWPTPFEKVPFADETCSHFHIPVIDFNKMNLLGQHEPPPHLNNKLTTWLCCSTKKQLEVV